MGSILELTDVKNKLEDLSGVELKPGENPYDALIDACHDNPVESALPYLLTYLVSPWPYSRSTRGRKRRFDKAFG